MDFSISAKKVEKVTGIVLNLSIILGSITMLPILSLPVHEHGCFICIIFNFIQQSFVIFRYQSFVSLIKFIPKYYFPFFHYFSPLIAFFYS